MGLLRREGTCPGCGAEDVEFELCPFLSDHPRSRCPVERYQCPACEAPFPDHTVFEDVHPPRPP